MINILCHTPFTLLPSIKFGKIEMRLFKVFILLSYAIFTGSVFAQTSIELVKVAGYRGTCSACCFIAKKRQILNAYALRHF